MVDTKPYCFFCQYVSPNLGKEVSPRRVPRQRSFPQKGTSAKKFPQTSAKKFPQTSAKKFPGFLIYRYFSFLDIRVNYCYLGQILLSYSFLVSFIIGFLHKYIIFQQI